VREPGGRGAIIKDDIYGARGFTQLLNGPPLRVGAAMNIQGAAMGSAPV
jgi:hypothetical protein